MTQSPAAQSPAAQPQSGSQGDQSEAMRHIAAIEAILNGQSGSRPAAGTTGSASSSSTDTRSKSAADTATSGSSTSDRATGTSGSSTATSGRSVTANSASTLDRADIEQIRTHLNALRRVLTQEIGK
jgi:hypothetical protein